MARLRRADLDVTIAGLGGTLIRGSHDVTYQCDERAACGDGVDLLT
jgi:hypothetical protein